MLVDSKRNKMRSFIIFSAVLLLCVSCGVAQDRGSEPRPDVSRQMKITNNQPVGELDAGQGDAAYDGVLTKLNQQEFEAATLRKAIGPDHVGKMPYYEYKLSKDRVPMDLLQYLGTAALGTTFLEIEEGIATQPGFVSKVAEDWVTKSDVSLLIQYVESRQPAASVTSGLSADISRCERSSVGVEAMAMIASYRYSDLGYPLGHTGCEFCKPEDQDKMADEYIKWWERVKDLPEDQIPKETFHSDSE